MPHRHLLLSMLALRTEAIRVLQEGSLPNIGSLPNLDEVVGGDLLDVMGEGGGSRRRTSVYDSSRRRSAPSSLFGDLDFALLARHTRPRAERASAARPPISSACTSCGVLLAAVESTTQAGNQDKAQR